MSFFAVKTLPGYDWPPLADAAIAQVWVACLELERTQWLDAAVIQAKQLEQVRELLAHCVTNVPYYRETLPAAGITPGAIQTFEDFRRLPLLPRRVYQERFSSFAAQ
jgi:phenylacetate-coenzyme A ligase PaaK-like adenylate-forming protein